MVAGVAGDSGDEALGDVTACCPSAVAEGCGAAVSELEGATALCGSVLVSNGIVEASSGVADGVEVAAGVLSNKLFVLCLAAPYVSVSEVIIKMMALALVSFVSKLPAPELPNRV